MAIGAVGFASLRRRTVSRAALVVWALVLGSVTIAYELDPGDGVKQAVARVARRSEPDDVVIAYGPARHLRTALDYYGPLRQTVEIVDRGERDVGELTGLVRRHARPGACLWLVLYKEKTPRGTRPAILEAARALGPSWTQSERLRIGEVTVYLWSDSASTAPARVNDRTDR
ncbi:hypothetical protein JW916_11610 [Candidatus Sumerlaeota bacterium]|nr:hypothetical protein [Candidatus Sumerlaeota bacterium]